MLSDYFESSGRNQTDQNCASYLKNTAAVITFAARILAAKGGGGGYVLLIKILQRV